MKIDAIDNDFSLTDDQWAVIKPIKIMTKIVPRLSKSKLNASFNPLPKLKKFSAKEDITLGDSMNCMIVLYPKIIYLFNLFLIIAIYPKFCKIAFFTVSY